MVDLGAISMSRTVTGYARERPNHRMTLPKRGRSATPVLVRRGRAWRLMRRR